jgi:DNA-binding protein H-NS
MKRLLIVTITVISISLIGCVQKPAATPPGGTESPTTTSETEVFESVVENTVTAIENPVEKVVEKTEEAAKPFADAVAEAVKESEKAVTTEVKKVEEEAKEEVKAVEQKVEKTAKELNADIVAAYKAKRKFDANNKPKAPIVLPKEYVTPDGMAVNPKTGSLFLSVPNFARRPNDTGKKLFPAVIAKVDIDAGTTETVLEIENIDNIKVSTEQIGPMGLSFGPDGNLYVADNQYFFDKSNKSRILRVLMDGDKPTGKVEIVVEGTKLSNAIYWTKDGNYLYLTDTFFDLDGHHGSGGVWQFKKDEILNAGSGENPAIQVKPITKGLGDDPHLISFHSVKKLPGCGNGGPDGLTVDGDGVIYYGFFDTGEMHRLVVDADGKVVATDEIHPAGVYFHCCDGIYYDAGTNKVYINDSAANAIHAFTPPKDTTQPITLETIWENGDTNGADGSLDQPCECVVIGKKMIIVNFDWPFPELINTASDDPSTLSVIELQ